MLRVNVHVMCRVLASLSETVGIVIVKIIKNNLPLARFVCAMHKMTDQLAEYKECLTL